MVRRLHTEAPNGAVNKRLSTSPIDFTIHFKMHENVEEMGLRESQPGIFKQLFGFKFNPPRESTLWKGFRRHDYSIWRHAITADIFPNCVHFIFHDNASQRHLVIQMTTTCLGESQFEATFKRICADVKMCDTWDAIAEIGLMPSHTDPSFPFPARMSKNFAKLHTPVGADLNTDTTVHWATSAAIPPDLLRTMRDNITKLSFDGYVTQALTLYGRCMSAVSFDTGDAKFCQVVLLAGVVETPVTDINISYYTYADQQWTLDAMSPGMRTLFHLSSSNDSDALAAEVFTVMSPILAKQFAYDMVDLTKRGSVSRTIFHKDKFINIYGSIIKENRCKFIGVDVSGSIPSLDALSVTDCCKCVIGLFSPHNPETNFPILYGLSTPFMRVLGVNNFQSDETWLEDHLSGQSFHTMLECLVRGYTIGYSHCEIQENGYIVKLSSICSNQLLFLHGEFSELDVMREDCSKDEEEKGSGGSTTSESEFRHNPVTFSEVHMEVLETKTVEFASESMVTRKEKCIGYLIQEFVGIRSKMSLAGVGAYCELSNYILHSKDGATEGEITFFQPILRSWWDERIETNMSNSSFTSQHPKSLFASTIVGTEHTNVLEDLAEFYGVGLYGVSSIAFWKNKLTSSSISFVLRNDDEQIVAAMTGLLAKTTTDDPLFYVSLVYSIYEGDGDEKECEKPSRYFMSKVRTIVRLLIPSDGIGHVLTQSVGYSYHRRHGLLSAKSSRIPYAYAGRTYWERQTRHNDYSVIFGVQLALNPDMIDWDCCFRHDFVRKVAVSPQCGRREYTRSRDVPNFDLHQSQL